MKPINTIIKMTVVGVVLFALNACDKKSADDANITAPTQTAQQSTQSDDASVPNDNAANPVAEQNGDGTNNTQAAAPAQESGTVTGGTESTQSTSEETTTVTGTTGTGSNVSDATTQEDMIASSSDTQTSNDCDTATNSTDEQNTTTSTETNTTTTGDTNTTDTNDTNATEGNDENTTDNGDDHTTTTADVTPPVITLKGEVNITLEQGEPYKELGATAVDAVDGNVSVTISGNVNMNTTGIYTVTYTAKDKAGNEATVTRDVSVVAPTLTGMTLESNATTLNVGESVQLFVTGTYTDGNRKQIDANISYTVTPSDKADINNILTAKKDGNVTVQATLDGKTSKPVALNIYWEVNGHRLPPEPDPVKNNATLLGIDSNNNGVRDDVERWIYKTYSHPIERGIFMQSARAYNKVIVDPSKAHETMKYNRKSFSCEAYWIYEAKDKNESFSLDRYRDLEKEIIPIQFNTFDRLIAHHRYEKALSGGVYSVPKADKNSCEFDENGILKAEK